MIRRRKKSSVQESLDPELRGNDCDNDAFFFLTLLLIMIVTVFFFKAEILQFMYTAL